MRPPRSIAPSARCAPGCTAAGRCSPPRCAPADLRHIRSRGAWHDCTADSGSRAACLARVESMSPEAVAAMERRLLEAFAAHHRSAGRAWRQWIAAAAALVLLAGAFAGWRGCPEDGRPASAECSGAAACERIPAVQPTGRTESAGNAPGRNQSRSSVPAIAPARAARGACPPPSRTTASGGAGGLCALAGRGRSPAIREWIDRARRSAAVVARGLRRRHFLRPAAPGPVQTDVLVGQDGEARAIGWSALLLYSIQSRSKQ